MTEVFSRLRNGQGFITAGQGISEHVATDFWSYPRPLPVPQ